MSSFFAWLTGSAEPTSSSPPSAPGDRGNQSAFFSFGSRFALRTERKEHKPFDRLLKLVMNGPSGAGKSSFLMRFTSDRFACEYKSTIGADFMSRQLRIGEHVVRLQTWDTSGQERFQSISRVYFRGADGVFLVFDVASRRSFEQIPAFLKDMRAMFDERTSPVILLVGQKVDLERQVSAKEAMAFARREGLSYVETSARTGKGVQEAFLHLTAEIGDRLGVNLHTEGNEVAMDISREAPEGEESEAEAVELFDEVDMAADLSHLCTRGERLDRADAPATAGGRRMRHARTDVNVFSLALASLAAPTPLATGDPELCEHCGAVLNSLCSLRQPHAAATTSAGSIAERAPPIHEKLQYSAEAAARQPAPAHEEREHAARVWECSFCGHENAAAGMEDGEMPQQPDAEYLIQPAPAAAAAASTSASACSPEARHKHVIFCVDTSGSMCVTSEIPRRVKVKGMERVERAARALRAEHEAEGDQYLRGQRRDATLVSRLQCVQAAVEEQIERLSREEPDTRVALVLFGSDVRVVGDGLQDERVVAGDMLSDYEQLEALAGQLLPTHAVRETRGALLQKLWAIEEEGTTALGPALLLSIVMAGGAAGSRVVLCTDGLANRGLGSLEGAQQDCTLFYTEMAEQAKLRGVVVSVVSVIGSECCLERLAGVCEQTGGRVARLDPVKLVGGFGGALLEGSVVGYHAIALIVLHPLVRFSGEHAVEHGARHWLVRDLGNVRDSTSLSFSYTFRSEEAAERAALQELSSVPFQVQVLYTRPDGARLLRVGTASVALTTERDVAEQHANVGLVAQHAAMQTADYAKRGQYSRAQMESRAAQRFLRRVDADARKVAQWSKQLETVDQISRQADTLEAAAPLLVRRDADVCKLAEAKVGRFW